jgi:hypothetical protein
MRRLAPRLRRPEEAVSAAQRAAGALLDGWAAPAPGLPAAPEPAGAGGVAAAPSGRACRRWHSPRPWLRHAGSTTSDMELSRQQRRHFLSALGAPAPKVHQERRLIG